MRAGPRTEGDTPATPQVPLYAKVGIGCHKSLTCDDVTAVSAHFCHGRALPRLVTPRQPFLVAGKLSTATDEGAPMRVTTRLKYGLFRLLGVVSPSGAYPLPPRWALNATGKHRFYDAPDCTGDCCPWNRQVAGCRLACCNLKPQTDAYGARTVQRVPDNVILLRGRERGNEAC